MLAIEDFKFWLAQPLVLCLGQCHRPPSPFLQCCSGEARLVELGVWQEVVVEGNGNLGDHRRPGVGRVRRHHGPTDHDRAVGPTLEAAGDPVV